MEKVLVNNKECLIDLEELLLSYITDGKVRGDKLLAPSPFRYERHPSFFVNLRGEYVGTWKDSGSTDNYYGSGGLVKLLAFLRGETQEETAEYLIEVYGVQDRYDNLRLGGGFKIPSPVKPLSSRILDRFEKGSSYLEGRGLSKESIERYKIYSCQDIDAVGFPWFNRNQELVNIKYRRKDSKIFFYQTGGLPLKNYLYGMDLLYNTDIRTVVLCEGEVDAISAYQLYKGKAVGLALGGSSFSDKQTEILYSSSIDKVIIGVDNDNVGKDLAKKLEKSLFPYMKVERFKFPTGIKDINEFLVKKGELFD